MCMCVCMCGVCMCAFCNLNSSKFFDTQTPNSILSYPVHLGFTLSARVLHLGIGGMGIGV